MTTMKNRRTFVDQVVERVHPLLELDGAQLLGGPFGRLAIEQRLDDAVDEQIGEPDRDSATTTMSRTGIASSRRNATIVAPGRLVEVRHRRSRSGLAGRRDGMRWVVATSMPRSVEAAVIDALAERRPSQLAIASAVPDRGHGRVRRTPFGVDAADPTGSIEASRTRRAEAIGFAANARPAASIAVVRLVDTRRVDDASTSKSIRARMPSLVDRPRRTPRRVRAPSIWDRRRRLRSSRAGARLSDSTSPETRTDLDASRRCRDWRSP